MAPQQTLYQIADAEIRRCIEVFLALAEKSKGLTSIEPSHLTEERTRVIVLAGFGAAVSTLSAEQVWTEWQRRQALPFDLETAITASVYSNLRSVAEQFYQQLSAATSEFKSFDADYISENPYLLPMLQHLCGVFSKAKLKELVGSVSDNSISKAAAKRLSALLSSRVSPSGVVRGEVLKRLESTLEGIVRDLVGRVLLESIVDAALKKRGLKFEREADYASLAGVIYDFRADFILPDAKSPLAFIEVRKSSSRHASLYAKDKMFSAINWKGRNRDLLGVLVVDGEWTGETLRAMARVFDYVVPIGRVDDLARSIEAYLNGDKTKLKWIVEFRIVSASPSEGSNPR